MRRFAIRRDEEDDQFEVSHLELFYDLVFVFTITQVSHYLLAHLSWEGAGQSLIVLLAVWWSWQYNAWVTSELDPEAIPVRLLQFTLMLLSMLMAVAIPDAFGSEALLFAGAYVAIQMLRHGFLAFVAAGRGTVERQRALHILTWFVAAGVFWIAGGLAEGEARTVLWLIALALDYGGPLATYWVPWLKDVTADAWNIGSRHFSERFALFVILTLGETIILTGVTTSEEPLTTERVLAFCLAFASTVCFWWFYFNFVAGYAGGRLGREDHRVLFARDVYTFGHIPLIAGILLSAVADETMIAHPGDPLETEHLLVTVGASVVYLLSFVAMRFRLGGGLAVRRFAGALACVAIGLIFRDAAAMLVYGLIVAVLVGVIVAEQIARIRRERRGEPTTAGGQGAT